jgi:hypothetical protein
MIRVPKQLCDTAEPDFRSPYNFVWDVENACVEARTTAPDNGSHYF